MPNEVDPRIARAYQAGLVLTAAGFRLERTDHSETKETGYRIMRGNVVVAGRGLTDFEMTLDQVVDFARAVS
jgi:hypothetical protein